VRSRSPQPSLVNRIVSSVRRAAALEAVRRRRAALQQAVAREGAVDETPA
jgi:hypothetical protein